MNSRSPSFNSCIPTSISKRIREARVARIERAAFFASDFARFFARVCHREDISDRPSEICVVGSVDECCNRARKMNPYVRGET